MVVCYEYESALGGDILLLALFQAIFHAKGFERPFCKFGTGIIPIFVLNTVDSVQFQEVVNPVGNPSSDGAFKSQLLTEFAAAHYPTLERLFLIHRYQVRSK